jgi:hypothetical protein
MNGMMKKSGGNSSFPSVQGKADLMEDGCFPSRRGKDGGYFVGLELSLPHRFFRCL